MNGSKSKMAQDGDPGKVAEMLFTNQLGWSFERDSGTGEIVGRKGKRKKETRAANLSRCIALAWGVEWITKPNRRTKIVITWSRPLRDEGRKTRTAWMNFGYRRTEFGMVRRNEEQGKDERAWRPNQALTNFAAISEEVAQSGWKKLGDGLEEMDNALTEMMREIEA